MQRAIEAQVEEHRHQRERERRPHAECRSKTRRGEEREREREQFQQQFINDKQKQRNREEVQSRKTEELYLSIWRAQEEAFKDKQLQRIRDLTKKGHDVSKLLQSHEGDSISQGCLTSSESQIQRVKPSTTTSPRRATAVQTGCTLHPFLQ
ncbi:coiled-coil domain-containing protein 66-like isoform X2 [Myxocyprinus asiaticus]|uniref:coiled-coil domain-containing protein 66-like isoform X2 n=1 Tax=Myxocyprinus asiaticus TaxID=70543 RepID=UPI002223128C|nr:coiled-coil domain-containing protein 66-like isoform X2 [Myxocyprinus asiaticus]